MATAYALTDELPKDSGGAKILAPINDQSTTLDFGILRGIGAHSLGAASLNVLHMAVGTHKTGSKLDAGHVGVVLLGTYTESASTVAYDNAQAIRVDREGAVYVRPASNVMSFSSASVQTHHVGSALLHDIIITTQDVNSGSIIFEDAGSYKLGFVVTAASENFAHSFATGLLFTASLTHTLADLGGGGGASVTITYST